MWNNWSALERSEKRTRKRKNINLQPNEKRGLEKSASTNRIQYFVVVFSFLLLLLSMPVQVPSFKGNIFSAQFRSRNHFLFLPFHFFLFFGSSFPSLLSFCSIFSHYYNTSAVIIPQACYLLKVPLSNEGITRDKDILPEREGKERTPSKLATLWTIWWGGITMRFMSSDDGNLLPLPFQPTARACVRKLPRFLPTFPADNANVTRATCIATSFAVLWASVRLAQPCHAVHDFLSDPAMESRSEKIFVHL